MLNNIISNLEAIEFLNTLEPQSVPIIATDLPYGTTAAGAKNKDGTPGWDIIIPFETLWPAVKRVLTPDGVFLSTAQEPFKSMMVCSNLKDYKLDIVWDKHRVTGFLNAKVRPMLRHETVIVFCAGSLPYYPAMTPGKAYHSHRDANTGYTEVYKNYNEQDSYSDGGRYPTTIFECGDTDIPRLHPTQKPVRLFKYLIQMFSAPGDLVVDPTCGSGTTAVAAAQLGRPFAVNDFGIDKRTGRPWTDIVKERVSNVVIETPMEKFMQKALSL